MSDFLCRITKTDSTTVTLWLPDKQVEAMADSNTPVGGTLAEALGIVAIEFLSPEERPGANVNERMEFLRTAGGPRPETHGFASLNTGGLLECPTR